MSSTHEYPIEKDGVWDEIRGLTWREPFATLMLHEKIETRTWSTKYRGPVLICAGKSPYSNIDVSRMSGSMAQRIIEISLQHNLHLGHAIAVGTLVDCRPMTKEDEARCFVKYRPGLWCHVYQHVRAIKPFPFKGQQGWKKLDEETIAKIEFK